MRAGRLVSPSRTCVGRLFGVLLVLYVVGCAALPAVVSVAGSLLNAATKNYAPDYAADVEKLMSGLVAAANVAAENATSELRVDSTAGEAAQPEPAVGLDVGFWRQVGQAGSERVKPLEDGAVVFTGERTKVTFRVDEDCFVYVVGIDGSGWATPMFPIAASSHRNPVQSGRDYKIPDQSYWFELDEVPGLEHIFVLASSEPQPELDEVFLDLDGRERPPGVPTHRVEQRAVLERGFRVTRDSATMSVSTESGQSQDVDLISFFSNSGGIVVTRWFEHR